ncbi:MAG: thioredoxin family protein [bacterium]|nr:thioredoxin family protein [bacterium]
MNENKPPIVPTTEPESLPSKGKSGRFWQWFWLTFLVVSLAYAWYSFYVPSNRATWTVNYTTAQEQAVESDKPIILFFTGKWCSPCRIMKREVWADEQVMATVNDAFIPVMIDVDDPNAAATLNHFRVGVTPTTIITDSKGNVLQYRQGRISRADFLEMLGQLDPPAVND